MNIARKSPIDLVWLGMGPFKQASRGSSLLWLAPTSALPNPCSTTSFAESPMKTRRNPTSSSRNSKTIRKSRQRSPADIGHARNPIPDLPPNEKIRRHPDKVYGETENPQRRPKKRVGS